MNYFLTQPYLRLFYPFKYGLSLNLNFVKTVSNNSKYITSALLLISLALGILYIWEFNAVLNMGGSAAVLSAKLKRTENELNKSEADFSKIYATAISSYLNKGNELERVSKIEYLEKKSLVEAEQYIP